MPMTWNAEADARVSFHLSATTNYTNVVQLLVAIIATGQPKMDYDELAKYMGGGTLSILTSLYEIQTSC